MHKIIILFIVISAFTNPLCSQEVRFKTITSDQIQNIPKNDTVFVVDYMKGFFKITWQYNPSTIFDVWVNENKILITEEIQQYKESKDLGEKKKFEQSKPIEIKILDCRTWPPAPYGKPNESDTYSSGNYKSITYTYNCYQGRYVAVEYSNYNCEGWKKSEYTSSCIY